MNFRSPKSALLVMDAQRIIVERLPASIDTAGPLQQIARALSHARESGTPVIYVIIAFRGEYPEIGPGNKVLGGVVARGHLTESDPKTAVHELIAPAPGDLVVRKRRTDSFFGSDLEIVLRAQGIDSLVLTGFTTSGVVLSTFLAAVDRDLDVTVLSDCCADQDPELHAMLTTKLFAHRARVSNVSEWIKLRL